ARSGLRPTGAAAGRAVPAELTPRPARRATRIAARLAVIAVIVAAISVTSVSHRPAFVATLRPTGAIMYVAASDGMTPIATATNWRGKPIKNGAIPEAIAITPDGKTAHVAHPHPPPPPPAPTRPQTPGPP